MRSLQVACIQLTPGNDMSRNISTALEQIDGAADAGAQLVALPEFCTFLDRSARAMRASAASEGESEALRALAGKAGERQIWLLVGSLVILPEDGDERLLNRSFLIASDGRVRGRYDKVHLFDAELSDGRRVGESRHYRPGGEATLVEAPFAKIGMTICYDLRFPGLYRDLARAGAELLLIPSAFAAETGRAHWEPLLRARAIETGAFVLAPATCGLHSGDWRTHGHSMIVDPWGEILSECQDDEPGCAMATIDLDRVTAVRGRLPSITTNAAYKLRIVRTADQPT